MFNNYKTNKTHNVKKTYHNFANDVVINKHSAINTIDTYNLTKLIKLVNFSDSNYFIKKIEHNSNITNDITRHNHNNYEHNVVEKVNKHIKHITNYDTEINYYSKKPLNKSHYYNFYHGNLNFRKVENISLTQQTDITNDITENITQTITYLNDNNNNKNNIATIIVNPTPSLTEHYLWIPEGITDNVVPGLGSLLTYIQSKYATLRALQNSITNINTTINNGIQNLRTEINNIEITNPQNVSKESHYHTSHTGFMYQGNTTNNGNRRQFVIQNHYFTYQRKGNHELQIQALNLIVADLQNQINNSSGGGSGSGGGEIGVS